AKEYLKLALSHKSHYFRHILAVTFTNKSTQEMKDRILAYLDDFANGKSNELAGELMDELRIDENTFKERSQEVQREILHNYSQFSISTIDAFFQRVIRSFTRESGLVGDYRLEVDQDLVLEEVIDDLIDELGNNKELTEWVVEFAKENLENDKAWDVRQSLRDFAQQIFREEFKEIEQDIINETNDHNFFKSLKSKLWQTKNFFLGKVTAPAQEALQIMHQAGWAVSEISWGKNSGLFNFFEMFASGKSLSDYKEPSDRIRNYFSVAKNWPSKTTRKADEIKRTAEVKLIPILQTLIDAFDKHFEQSLSAEVALKNMYVFGLIADISRKLSDYKKENNLMLLADAPKFLNKVIDDSDTPFIYEKVGSFYRNFLIDEFQDTSGYQWRNFFPLITNSLDQGYRSIVVGDVKQAVYRWRGGDLKLLQQEVEKQIGKNRVETSELDTNYRSASLIVDFNNTLFKQAASMVATRTSESLPQAAFNDVAQQVSKKDTKGFVQIQFIREEDPNNDSPALPTGQAGSRQGWKEMALERIPAHLEHLQGLGIRLSDIAILVRKNDEGQKIASYLLQYKNSEKAKPKCLYDVISNELLRLDGAASVNLLLAAMRYLLNAEDAIARAQLAYEFARLREPERTLREVFTVSNQVNFENNLPEAFTKSKAWLKKLPLFELTETLIDIFTIKDIQGELAYLQAFQDVVLEFYSRERNDLGAFLEWWEVYRDKKSLQVSGDVNAVQIVTVHKSKGLQFKYVLIPFCSWAMDHEQFKEPLLWVKSDEHPFKEAGYLPVKYSSKLKESYFGDFYLHEYVRTYLDNLNLLYVAFTRAENALMVTAPHPKNRDQKYSVARLIYECINATIELKENWSDSTQQIKIGELIAEREKNEPAINSLNLQAYHTSRWRDKLVIKKSSSVFFEEFDKEAFEKVQHGLRMHAVLSRIHYAEELDDVMNAIVIEGLILIQEKDSLKSQMKELLNQDQVGDWFSKAWSVRTEIPILLPGGDESRIDRLMIRDKKAVVVDFKTGERSKRDINQVLDYIKTLHKMNFTDVEGYLLYLRDGEVVNVLREEKIKTKTKKDDKQLGLGF
ncbi:MAG: UvrD-helicase domain-containing protein, partial [Flammeovirgaceae bacterium]|nr:UvrD-helicase domain-containing protein [Flammeovirgaceae bacterium]